MRLCIFCYKIVPDNPSCFEDEVVDKEGLFRGENSGENLDRSLRKIKTFIRSVGRFLGKEEIDHHKVLIDDWNERLLGCCDECQVLVNFFNEAYHQLRLLELQLEWRLESLKSIMELTNRIPTRIKRLNMLMEETDGGNTEKMGASWLTSFKTFRHNLIKICNRKLERSEPRVLVERMEQEPADNVVDSGGTGVLGMVTPNSDRSENIFQGVFTKLENEEYMEGDDDWFPAEEENCLDVQPLRINDFSNVEMDESVNVVSPTTLEAEKNTRKYNPSSSSSHTKWTSGKPNKKLYRCGMCDMSFHSNISLLVHKSSKTHKHVLKKQLLENQNTRGTSLTKDNEALPEENTPTNDKIAEPTHSASPIRYNFRENRKRSYQTYDDDPELHHSHSDNSEDDGTASSDGDSDTYMGTPRRGSCGQSAKDVGKASPGENGAKEESPPLVECDICKLKVPEWIQESHFKHSHDTAAMHPDDIKRCSEPDCSAFFKTELQLSHHKKVVHFSPPNEQKKKPSKIEMLNERAKNRKQDDRRRISVKINKAGPRYQCPVRGCIKAYATKKALDDHSKLHGNFKCQFCPVVKNYVPDLATHEVEEHAVKREDDDNQLHCSRCTQSYPSDVGTKKMEIFFKHFYKSHMSLSTDKCGICGHQQFSIEGKRAHFNKYHKISGLNDQEIERCEDCPAYFVKKDQLLHHKYHIHYEGKCPECGKACQSSSSLQSHLLSSHYSEKAKLRNQKRLEQPEKPIESEGKKKPCLICDASILVTEMFEHLQGHVGDYTLKCPRDSCSYCGPCSNALRYHFKISPRCKVAGKEMIRELFTCKVCGFAADNRAAFRSHLKRSHERGSEKTFKCPISGCDASFCARQSVDCHLASHIVYNKPRNFISQECEFCSEKIKLKEMEKHLKERHDAKEILNCLLCSFTFATRNSLMNHLHAHRKKGGICDICKVKFSSYPKLCRHYETVHQIKAMQFVCDQCGKSWITRDLLRKHVRTFHSSSDPSLITAGNRNAKKPKRFPCKLCDTSVAFRYEEDLISHKIRVHGEEPFKCKYCLEQFTDVKKLCRHQKEHEGVQFKKEWKCEVEGCPKVFKEKHQWSRHNSMGHTNDRPFVCEICGKSYRESGGLKQHNDTVHLGLRPWVCDTCGEAFCSGTILRRHKLIHTGERPFKCEICGQAFRQNNALQAHVKSHQEKGSSFRPMGPMKHIRKRKHN